ncbi:MAG: ABC transporter ATP-binding protein, partial [Bacillota bacterium]
MNKKIIEIKNLTKIFSGFKALNGINLEVEKGEIVGLLGPNGAGKTTTLKILMGLLKPTEGSIKIMGEKIKKQLPTWLKNKIGVVFEESNLYLRLNAIDNLKLFAGINNVNQSKIKELLAEYHLEAAAKREIRTFSKGMKKRLMICRSLIAEPEILILDEATGGLDPIS